MKSFYFGVSICLLLMFTACENKQDNTMVEEANRVIKVKADTIRLTKVISKLHYSGTIEPLQTISLSFEGIGTVESVLVQEGDIVKKGQLLATIDRADNVNYTQAAEAQYNQAKDAYDRMKSVYEKGSLPEIKWVEIESTLKQAEAQLSISKSSVKKCDLRAPVDGMVGKRDVEPGQSSLSLKSPIELVKIESILVKISVAENEICNIKRGQKATFSIPALHGKIFQGTVSNVGIVANEFSRTYSVKIMAPNSNLEIKPGMVCDVNLDTDIEKDCVVISNIAVSKDNEGYRYVFVVNHDNKSVKKQKVTLGNYLNNGIEVIEGVRPGQVVIVEGIEKLSDNSLISL